MERENLKTYFEEICGYEDCKKELIYLADVMRNPEAYSKLGAKVPQNLLLDGDPGVGKTLMATCLINASGRPSFICRKTEGEKDFMEVINDTFRMAAENAPSIVLLDDMDKFAGRYQSEASEFAAVQACLDDTRDKDVFVIATVNDGDGISASLIRPGRFDRRLIIGLPDPESAGLIIDRYFMTGDRMSSDMDREVLVQLTSGMTAAEIMTLANEAGVYAGYERADEICMRHIIRAFIESIGNVKGSGNDEEHARVTACHEAGHAVMSELLEPGSVALVFASDVSSDSNGFMSRGRSKRIISSGQYRIDTLTALAGRAATQVVYGKPDRGSESDIKEAFSAIETEVCGSCVTGLKYVKASPWKVESEMRRSARDTAVRKRMLEYYEEAMTILRRNREFLDRMTDELCRCGYLMQKDIAIVRREIHISKENIDMLQGRPVSEAKEEKYKERQYA